MGPFPLSSSAGTGSGGGGGSITEVLAERGATATSEPLSAFLGGRLPLLLVTMPSMPLEPIVTSTEVGRPSGLPEFRGTCRVGGGEVPSTEILGWLGASI